MTTTTDDHGECPGREALEQMAAGAEIGPVAAHLASCDRCAREVRRIRRDNALLADFLAANVEAFDAAGPAVPAIEGYELQEEIHRGAQGVVYSAVQLATKRVVAVKTLARGAFATARQRHRFEREVELVATLRHPNIVTIFDSGRTADGGHFLAMEFVDGVALNEYVNRPETGTAAGGVRATLSLFADICEGVSAAHRRGIIHRDLKPANILVDEQGVPRVLDFGLAKRADDQAEMLATAAGEFLGTLAYAAPEQVHGDPHAVDVRSDVYALGVILYEMLTGRRPYALAGGMTEVIRTITDAPPDPPIRMGRPIGDELETIVLKALAKDPVRRYQSAGALLEDVRHYLAGEPINAKRDSPWYLARKTLARHRVAAAVIGAFFAVLLTFGVTMTVLFRQATLARQDADFEAARATETLGSLLALLGSDPLQSRTTEDTLNQLYGEADRIVTRNLTDPEIEAEVRRTLGLAQLRRGEWEYAHAQFRKTVELERRLHEGDHDRIAEALHNDGRALWRLGRYDDAEERYRAALQMRLALFGSRHELVAETMSHLGATLRQQGEYVEAEPYYRSTLELRRELHGDRDPLVARSLNSLGVCLRDQARCDEALPLLQDALLIIRESEGAMDEGESATLHNIGTCLIELGRAEEAETVLTQALALKRRRYDDTHSSIAFTECALARSWLEQGRIDEAETTCRRALAVQEERYGPAHTEVADSMLLLGRILLAKQEDFEAREALERALAIRRERLPAGHVKVVEVEALLER